MVNVQKTRSYLLYHTTFVDHVRAHSWEYFHCASAARIFTIRNDILYTTNYYCPIYYVDTYTIQLINKEGIWKKPGYYCDFGVVINYFTRTCHISY